MKTLLKRTTLIALGVLSLALAPSAKTPVHSPSMQDTTKGTVVAYPWVFQKGTETSRKTAVITAEEIGRRAGYASIPTSVAAEAWRTHKYATPSYGRLPSTTTLRAFGKSLKATVVLYGSVSWHTRSIWVNAGPKTISTATVNVYALNVATGKVVFRGSRKGRSDEKENVYKVAAAILFTPLVTAVSGGPKTPQEQRAVQIAMSLAYQSWVNKK